MVRKAKTYCIIILLLTQVVKYSNVQSQNKSLNYYLENGQTPLIKAILDQDLELVSQLLEQAANPNFSEKENLKGTPLMYASSVNNSKFLKALILYGADVNAVDVNNDPAINWATYYGYIKNMGLLIKNGADLSITSKHGTSVAVALRLWHADSVMDVFRHSPFAEKRSSKERKIIAAVLAKDIITVKKLFQLGVSANTTDVLKTPLLQLASQTGDLPMVTLLVENGALLDGFNMVGQSALAYAARFGHQAIVDYLLQKGANPNACGNLYKLTPLIGAAVGGYSTIGQDLINAGADINHIDIVNQSGALHFAMFYGNIDFITFILNKGADYKSKVLDDKYTGYSLAKSYGYESTLALMDKLELASNRMLGSWKVTKIDYVYKDTTYTLEEPYPGRLLVTPWRYSIIYNPWSDARIPFKVLSKPTDAEMLHAFKTLVFNTGTYQIENGFFITTADIAKVPGFEGGVQKYKFSITGNELTYTMVDETYPDGSKPSWFGKLEVKFTLLKE